MVLLDHERPRKPTMPIASLTIREELGYIVAFIGVILGSVHGQPSYSQTGVVTAWFPARCADRRDSGHAILA